MNSVRHLTDQALCETYDPTGFSLKEMAHRLHERQFGFNVIGWVYIKRPCEFIWLGELSPGLAINGPVYLGRK